MAYVSKPSLAVLLVSCGSISAGLSLSCAVQIDEEPPVGSQLTSDGSEPSPSGTDSAPVSPSSSANNPSSPPAMGAPTQPGDDNPPPNSAAPVPVAPDPTNTPSGEGGASPDPNQEPMPPGDVPSAEPPAGGGGSAGGGEGGAGGGAAPMPTSPAIEPPDPDGMELFFDDFEDGNADGWVPDAEDGVLGDWMVGPGNGGQSYQLGTITTDETWTYAGDPTWTDQFIQVDLQFNSTSDAVENAPPEDMVGEDGFFYLRGRRSAPADDPDDFNYVTLEFRSDGDFRVRERYNGSTTQIAPLESYANLGFVPTSGQWNRLGFSFQGTTVIVMLAAVNGAWLEVLRGETVLTAGQIGIGTVDATIAVDNVLVTVP